MTRYTLHITIFLFCATLLNPALQAFDFDYHRPEAASPSWHSGFFYDARALGAGGISLLGDSILGAVANPALSSFIGNTSFRVSFSLLDLSAFQYATYNTGYVTSSEPLSESFADITAAAAGLKLDTFGVSAGFYRDSAFNLPDYSFSSSQGGTTQMYEHMGWEDIFYLSAAGEVMSNFHAGIKFAYVSGYYDAVLTDPYGYATISQEENYSWNYMLANIGIVYSPHQAVTAAFCYEMSFTGEVEESYTRIFDGTPAGGTRVETNTTATDDYERPAKFTGSIIYAPDRKQGELRGLFNIAFELNYALWEDYTYRLFGVDIDRGLKNRIELALGIEKIFLFKGGDFRLSGGYRYDPQPLTNPEVALGWITGGAGLRLGPVQADAGIAFISSDSDDWEQSDLIVSFTLGYNFR